MRLFGDVINDKINTTNKKKMKMDDHQNLLFHSVFVLWFVKWFTWQFFFGFFFWGGLQQEKLPGVPAIHRCPCPTFYPGTVRVVGWRVWPSKIYAHSPYWASEITKYPAQVLSRPLWLRWHGGDLTPHAGLISGHVYVLWSNFVPLLPDHPLVFTFPGLSPSFHDSLRLSHRQLRPPPNPPWAPPLKSTAFLLPLYIKPPIPLHNLTTPT